LPKSPRNSNRATPNVMLAAPELRIVVTKQARELALLAGSTTQRRYPIVLGRNALADKTAEGDEATPLGEF
jgi:murein L,D-transpeptidase YafK